MHSALNCHVVWAELRAVSHVVWAELRAISNVVWAKLPAFIHAVDKIACCQS